MSSSGQDLVVGLTSPSFSLSLQIGPILVGMMLQLSLYGFTLSHLINIRSSPTWTRSSRATRAVCYGVVLLNTAYTALTAVGMWNWGTLTARDYATIAAGDVPSSAGPIILTTIAVVVQMTLAVRSSKVSHSSRSMRGRSGRSCID